MDEELYDEFGNYIGPEIEHDHHDDDDSDSHSLAESMSETRSDDETSSRVPFQQKSSHQQLARMDMDDEPSNQVVLHEDKQYYPSAESVYGRDVEALVQEEDTQPLSEPIIAPIKVRKFQLQEKDLPATTYNKE